MGAHRLSDNYRAERLQLLELGRSLDQDTAAALTSACPEWSIKDIYAHLAGIADNIATGDTEGAATEAWADGHVAARKDQSLAQVLDEWASAGEQVSAAMEVAGEMFPLQLFIDQWTHGWDIRSQLGDAAAAVPDTSVIAHFADELLHGVQERTPDGAAALQLRVANRTVQLGRGPVVGELALGLFDFGRILMGRRSLVQLQQLEWPKPIDDPAPYIDALVFWSVNGQDVIDPVTA